MSERADQHPDEPVPEQLDQPTAEVLDELLRAFSADTDDAERLAAVDLASPEVAELLEPTGSVPAGIRDADTDAGPGPDPQVEDEPAPPIDPLLQPAIETEGEVDADGEATGGGEPGANGDGPQTIVIADDSLPDAVYLEGSLEETSAATTVFIDDDRTGEDTYGASDAVRVEPRFRERRIAVRRSQGRRRLRWVIVATVVLAILVAGFAVLGSSLFAVSAVEVEGRRYSDEAAVDAVVEDLLDTPVLRVDTGAAEEELERIPWVEEAVVSTDFPHGAKIELRERVPVAWFRGGDGRYRVIDREGRVLDVLAGEPQRYVSVESSGPPSPEAGEFAPRGFGAAASLVDAMTPTMRDLTRAVVATADGNDLRLSLDAGTEVRFGRAEDLVNKLVRLQTVMDNESIVNPHVIDVSTSEVTVQ